MPAEAVALAELFGGETGDEGVPILADCPSWFVGRVLDRVDAGDHVGFLLEPVAAEHGATVAALTFHRARNIEPGHPA